jgi:Tfp pilus assembly protein PilN
MTQKINFYTDILRQRNIPLSFRTMKHFTYVLLIFMFFVTLILVIKQLKTKHDLKSLEKIRLSSSSQLKSQESKITPRQEREQIVSQLEITEKSYDKNKQTLELLDKLIAVESEGFSKYLTSLSRSVPSGLWLTKIELFNSGRQFSLRGKTMQPNLITDFIESLRKEEPFSGKILRLLDMTYNKEEGSSEFTIQTETQKTT